MNGVYQSSSYEETLALGRRMGERLARRRACSVIAYTGGLGMGKTAFTAGLAAGLGVRARVLSPTFAIVNEYEGARRLCHFDMYRLSSAEDLYGIGWYDYLADGNVCAVEWSEKVAELLPPDCIRVELARGAGENDRVITVSGFPEEEEEKA